MNRFNRPAPTAETVIAAVRKFEEQGHLYTVTREGEGDATVWQVAHTTNKLSAYEVCVNPFTEDESFPLTCTCPAHERGGYCKHVAKVEDFEAIEAAASDYEHRHEAEYAGRF